MFTPYLGWCDIGYNFLIGGDGAVYTGRGWDKVGAHTPGYNDRGVAFSLIGNFEEFPVPQNMLDTAEDLIECATGEAVRNLLIVYRKGDIAVADPGFPVGGADLVGGGTPTPEVATFQNICMSK